MPRQRAIDTPAGWLRANGVDLAPLTGQDYAALNAIAACWDLYFRVSLHEQRRVLAAIGALLSTMQPKCWDLTKKLIARSGDWSHVDELWPKVLPLRAS